MLPASCAADVATTEYPNAWNCDSRDFSDAKDGQVLLVGDEHKSAVIAFRGDDPPVHQLVVVGWIGRNDAQDLGDVGREQLFAMRVGTKQERASRLDRVDDAVGVAGQRDLDAIAAGDGEAASANQADDSAALVEEHDVVSPVRGGDQALHDAP